MTINFFLGHHEGCIEVWTNCTSIPRIYDLVTLNNYDPLRVVKVNWLGSHTIEITLTQSRD